MIGLGTMGRNLIFNMNDHGYSVIGFERNDREGIFTHTGIKQNGVSYKGKTHDHSYTWSYG